MNAKSIIIETAHSLGFQKAVIASLEPLEAERLFYEAWLASGYAASMDYLKRNPEKRNSPALLCPEAYSAILLFASYYTKPPEDPGPQFGRVARYAVGFDYHLVLPQKLESLRAALEEKLGRAILGRVFSDDVELFEPALASRHGLGFTGKNSLIIAPGLDGSYHFIAELFTDIPLEADRPYKGTCGGCVRCLTACPTKAIVGEKTVDANSCISFLTIENKAAIPTHLRALLGPWVFGCDVCQEVCPYNQASPETAWSEFRPESGVGHYLNLFDLLKIQDKKQFLALFGQTPLARPKRKGLLRNALVVLGNRLPDSGQKKIFDFLLTEQEPLLLEHAIWALDLYSDSKPYLERLYEKRAECREMLNSCRQL
ncbi:MAG: tRNA epoxyqueuosine(34) reductase QueG [Candidatus Obscuribacterales bacterium]|nr:tRNA epoxyqueuosine(34) reductase QueG [Candidatus Obscuribacterales bacterium]